MYALEQQIQKLTAQSDDQEIQQTAREKKVGSFCDAEQATGAKELRSSTVAQNLSRGVVQSLQMTGSCESGEGAAENEGPLWRARGCSGAVENEGRRSCGERERGAVGNEVLEQQIQKFTAQCEKTSGYDEATRAKELRSSSTVAQNLSQTISERDTPRPPVEISEMASANYLGMHLGGRPVRSAANPGGGRPVRSSANPGETNGQSNSYGTNVETEEGGGHLLQVGIRKAEASEGRRSRTSTEDEGNAISADPCTIRGNSVGTSDAGNGSLTADEKPTVHEKINLQARKEHGGKNSVGVMVGLEQSPGLKIEGRGLDGNQVVEGGARGHDLLEDRADEPKQAPFEGAPSDTLRTAAHHTSRCTTAAHQVAPPRPRRRPIAIAHPDVGPSISTKHESTASGSSSDPSSSPGDGSAPHHTTSAVPTSSSATNPHNGPAISSSATTSRGSAISSSANGSAISDGEGGGDRHHLQPPERLRVRFRDEAGRVVTPRMGSPLAKARRRSHLKRLSNGEPARPLPVV